MGALGLPNPTHRGGRRPARIPGTRGRPHSPGREPGHPPGRCSGRPSPPDPPTRSNPRLQLRTGPPLPRMASTSSPWTSHPAWGTTGGCNSVQGYPSTSGPGPTDHPG